MLITCYSSDSEMKFKFLGIAEELLNVLTSLFFRWFSARSPALTFSKSYIVLVEIQADPMGCELSRWRIAYAIFFI